MRTSLPPVLRACLAVLLAAASHGCGERDPLPPAAAAPARANLALEVSDVRAMPGSVVAVALAQSRDASPAAGVQGTLSWDPALLRYVGQVVEDGTVVVANDALAGEGRLRFVAVRPGGLGERLAVFAFEVRGPRWAGGLRFVPEGVAASDGSALGVLRNVEASTPSDPLPDPAGARRMDLEAWRALLGALPLAEGPLAVPGEAGLFGDGNLDGSVNVFDVLYAASASVLVEPCILNTDGPAFVGRDCIAVNVRPANLPGLGEQTDACPPGQDVCGTTLRTVDVFDVLAISQWNVGYPEPVVGLAIPSSPHVGTRVLTGTISGPRTLRADTVYTLQGILRVGDDAGALSGELFISAGTRLEAADASSGIVVGRNGRISAEGTQFQPVVFTCAGTPAPGCWRGLEIHGNALVNTGTATSPVIAGRSTSGGCTQGSSPFGSYGGCQDADSSGVLRWVRIENAGNGMAALDLRGVGSSTSLEQVYVLRSAGESIRLAGGSARVKRARLIAPGTKGWAWTEGWRGKAQHVLIQTESGTVAIEGANSSSNPNASPRSAPTMYNVTVIGPPDPTGKPEGIAGVDLRDGTSGFMRSFLFYAKPYPDQRVLRILGADAYGRFAAGDLELEQSLIVGFGRLGDGGVDLVGGVPYVSPGVEDQYLRDTLASANTIVTDFTIADSLFFGPFARVPDFRPLTHRLGVVGVCPGAPAGDGFFDATDYCGATLDAYDKIPWFEPAPLRDMTGVPVDPQPAFLTFTLVTAQESAPLRGVHLNGVPSGGTDALGRYFSYVPAAGIVVSYDIPDSLRTHYNLCPPSFDVISGFAPRANVFRTVTIPDCP